METIKHFVHPNLHVENIIYCFGVAGTFYLFADFVCYLFVLNFVFHATFSFENNKCISISITLLVCLHTFLKSALQPEVLSIN